MKLFELRRELQAALDVFGAGDEDRELRPADVERIETRVLRVMVDAYVKAKSVQNRRGR